MKVFVTTYALSDGIIEAELRKETLGGWYGTVKRGEYPCYWGEKNICLTIEAARAEQMRLAKIASLKKQIEKLEKLKF